MRKQIKKKEHEQLSSSNIQKVIGLLNPQDASVKPITKKDACEILNISYNTTRLTQIIQNHLDQKEYVSKRKAQNRGKAASNSEICEAVTDYLQGATVSDISRRLYRSAGFVKTLLDKVGVPHRPGNDEERKELEYFPDECVSEDFAVGEIAWSSTYHSTVIVDQKLTKEYISDNSGLQAFDYERKYGTYCYAVYVLQKLKSEDLDIQTGGFNAYVPAYELGKLEHLKKYGLDLSRI